MSARTGSTSQAVAFTVPSAAGYGGGLLVACLDPSDQFTLIAAPKDLPLGNVHCWSNGTAVRLCRHPWVQGRAKAIPILIPGCVQKSKVAPHMGPKRIRTPSTRRGPGIPGG